MPCSYYVSVQMCFCRSHCVYSLESIRFLDIDTEVKCCSCCVFLIRTPSPPSSKYDNTIQSMPSKSFTMCKPGSNNENSRPHSKSHRPENKNWRLLTLFSIPSGRMSLFNGNRRLALFLFMHISLLQNPHQFHGIHNVFFFQTCKLGFKKKNTSSQMNKLYLISTG